MIQQIGVEQPFISAICRVRYKLRKIKKLRRPIPAKYSTSHRASDPKSVKPAVHFTVCYCQARCPGINYKRKRSSIPIGVEHVQLVHISRNGVVKLYSYLVWLEHLHVVDVDVARFGMSNRISSYPQTNRRTASKIADDIDVLNGFERASSLDCNGR